MPLYDFTCPIHGTYELFLPKAPDLDYRECDQDSECVEMAELEVPLVSMQPDPYWAGHVVHGKYVTKKRDIDTNIVPYTRDAVEYVQKRKRQAENELMETRSNNLKKFLTEELSSVTIDNDGNTLKQRKKYARARNDNY